VICRKISNQLLVLSETSQQGSNGCISHADMQTSPVTFTSGPETETETRQDEELEDDDNDDDDDDDDDDEVIEEMGHGGDAVVSVQLRRDVTEDDLPPQNVSRFDGRQKRSGFIDVWWLFDDGGMQVKFTTCRIYLIFYFSGNPELTLIKFGLKVHSQK